MMRFMFWPPLSQYLKIFRKGKNKKANDAQLKKEKGICYAVLRKYSNKKKEMFLIPSFPMT